MQIVFYEDTICNINIIFFWIYKEHKEQVTVLEKGKRGQVSTFDITPSKDATVDDS